MNTKRILFLAHDPGGYDVIHPVVQKLILTEPSIAFYCVGPTAKLNPIYAETEERVFEILRNRIDLGNISLLVTGTSWGSDFELRAISLCKSDKIKTAAILDYWSNYALRLSDSAQTVIYPDYYVVMDQLAKKEAIDEGVPTSIIQVLGHPGLDRFIKLRTRNAEKSFENKENEQIMRNGQNKQVKQNVRNEQNKQNEDIFKILFLSQPLSQLYGDSLGYTERSVLEDCVCAVNSDAKGVDTIGSNSSGSNVKGYGAYDSSSFISRQLNVKFHPKDDEALQKDYADIAVQGDLLELLPKYDLVIGMNTMGLLHAVLLGNQAISYQPGLKQPDVCITNQLGLTPLVTSYQDLLKELGKLQAGKSKPTGEYLSQKYLWGDGKSTDRIANFLQEVVSADEN